MATTAIQTTYGDMKTKEFVAPMIGLSSNDPFEIVSESDSLVMIHYRQDADMKIFGNIRGVVIDTAHGNVICSSYPYAETFVSPSLNVDSENKINLGENSLDFEKLRFKIGFEGTIIYVFKHAGKVYRSTRKRLDPSKSRWGASKTFGEMYWELNGPTDEILFNSEKDYSPYCHAFIMVHPDVLVSTKDDVNTGYLVYLGPKLMYTTENCPYPIESVDFDLHVPDTSSALNVSEEGPKIYSPANLTLEEVNKHLLFGFYEGFEGYQYLDSRILPGEFVIIENIETGQMFRVESTSYAWRSEMRNNNPNLLHRFFELLDYAYLRNNTEDDKKYRDKFPILTLYDQNSLRGTIEQNPIIVWPQNTEEELSVPTTKDAKLYNIWQSFLAATPINRQKEVIDFFDVLVARRTELVNWLIERSESSQMVIGDYSKRMQDILTKTRTFAIDRYNKGENIDMKTKESKSVEAMTRDNIKNFISKEMGSSLYRLIREMDRFKKLQEKTI